MPLPPEVWPPEAGPSEAGPSEACPLEVWIDRGGTFTDGVLFDRVTGRARTHKEPSGEGSELRLVRALLQLEFFEPLPPLRVRMGSTIGTNALLERSGGAVRLITTKGFADLVQIRDQTRPDLFDLSARRPEPLPVRCTEVDLRADSEGVVRGSGDLDTDGWQDAPSVAVVLVNGHRAPEMERRIKEKALSAGAASVLCSHEASTEDGFSARLETTIADAYLTPLIKHHAQAFASSALEAHADSQLLLMKSSGGLCPPSQFRGKDSVLSGPAAGALAAGHVAKSLGLQEAIGFDMGGTSTDVCRLSPDPERTTEIEVARVRLRSNVVNIHTVAAGGGSVCSDDSGRFTVGPKSAGASPGPLCYGDPLATELTLTDVNVVLGRALADRFPIPVDPKRAHAALRALAERRGSIELPAQLAEGFFRVAVETMAEAIREVSTRKGFDVRTHALIAFGGAAGQHACAVARALGISQVISHPLGSVMSAFGMGVGARTVELERSALGLTLTGIFEEASELARRATEQLCREGTLGERREMQLSVRYERTDTIIEIPLRDSDTTETVSERFRSKFRTLFGYERDGESIELVTLRVTVGGAGLVERARISVEASRSLNDQILSPRKLFFRGAWASVRVVNREELVFGEREPGPLIVLDAGSTFVVEPGFEAVLNEDGVLVATDLLAPSITKGEAEADAPAGVDPVLLEVFNHRFMGVAESMGNTLRRTALSTNIRDRLDFSCALFTETGDLVANAPHIPVHLGAMSRTVKALLKSSHYVGVGDAFVTNDPALGGSHLPDLTVVAPVHSLDGEIRYFVASRAHHSDVGGVSPGSMPAFSTNLNEEGIVLPFVKVQTNGELTPEEFLFRMASGQNPARRPQENLGDLRAQVAACRLGVNLLLALDLQSSPPHVRGYMGHVLDYSEKKVRAALERLGEGPFSASDAMDDGTVVAVTVSRTHGEGREPEWIVDFQGTGTVHSGNLNAPRAVTDAAVLYVLRVLTAEPIPLNAGFLRPVQVRVPTPSILCPTPSAAVSGGNVETSQRVVDVLLRALGLAACSQGTMNNVAIGDATFGYYETIGGGAGATEDKSGQSGTHTHMTNSRATDPETLERNFPLRITEFSLRGNSGGKGVTSGGDGLVREYELLADCEVSLVTERRTRAPRGVKGGEDGAKGRNFHNGRPVAGRTSFHAKAGDKIRIETPGGAGWGHRPR